jgi:hypothetical protein
MPQLQQYRLRLTEGTQLLVDHDALGVWINDEKALVQPPGSQRWRLLRQFLADEKSAPRRPQLAKGESARGEPVVWADGGPSADPAFQTPQTPSDNDDEIFAPDLSETDAPWEWSEEPEPPAAASAAETDAGEAEFPDFEFPNDDILTLDDLVAPVEAPAAPTVSESTQAAAEPEPEWEEPEVAPILSEEAVALAASCDTLATVLQEAPAPPPASLLDDELAHLTESRPRRSGSAVQVLADGLAGSPPPACDGDGIARIALKPLDPEPVMAPVAAELAPGEEPIEAVDWGPGLLGRFCCTVADWSNTVTGWIDRRKDATTYRREYHARGTQGLPDDTRALLTAWRELIAGWWSRLRR